MGADLIGYLMEVPIKLPKSALKRAVRVVMTVRREDDGFEEDPLAPLPTFREAEELVNELMSRWFERGRDCCIRASPHRPRTHYLVFCGDMSWGDPPGGASYQYFNELSGRGLFEAFGIR